MFDFLNRVGCKIRHRTNTQTGPVGAVGAHRFHHVGHGHDAGFGKDLIPDQAVGVAAAVDPLMMFVDDAGNRTGEGHVLEDLVAGLDVFLDQVVFVARQLGGFAENLRRHHDLADVVHGRRQPHGLQFCWGEPQFLPDRDRQVVHPPLVCGGVGGSAVPPCPPAPRPAVGRAAPVP